jgi:hypothetical protein
LLECKLNSHHGKQYGSSSKEVKRELLYDPTITILNMYPKEKK